MDPAADRDGLRLAATRLKVRAHRQSLLANAGSLEAEDQAFVDAISLWPDQARE
jgi:hypothetical protein